jgi:hypothetical protein
MMPWMGKVDGAPKSVWTFLYPNLRGDMRPRRVQPRMVMWDKSQESSEPTWLLHAFDLTEREDRLFVMRDMQDVDSV